MVTLSIAIGMLGDPALAQAVPLLLLVAVAASTALGGALPGLLSIALGTLAHDFLLADPRPEGAVAAPPVSSMLLALSGVAVGALGAGLRRAALQARARATAAQHQAEQYRLAIDATHDAIWDWDIRSGHILWSDAITKLSGCQDALPGTDIDWWQQRLHPDDRERVIASLDAVIEGSADAWVDEYRFQRADGSYADVLDRGGWVMRDEDGRAVRMIGAMLDMTGRRQAELAQRESELRFRQLAENIRDVFWVKDAREHRVIYVSPAFERLWGFRCEDLYADHQIWENAVHPEDRAHVVAMMYEQSLRGMADEEYRIVTPDGQLRWVRDRGFPVADQSGQVYRIAGIAEDITERRQAEASRHFLIALAERMSQTGSPAALIDLVTHAVSEHLDVTRCAFGEVALDGQHMYVEREHCRGLPTLVGIHSIGGRCEPLIEDLRGGRVVAIADVATDPRTASEYTERFLPHGVRALVAVPLLHGGAWTALLWLGSDRARAWTDTELTLLCTVAERAWLAVENARLLEQTLAALQERDASLRALQDIDMRLGMALEAAHVGIYEWDLTTDAMICSPGYATLFGRLPGTFAHCGAELRQAIHPEDRPRIEDNLACAVTAAQGPEEIHCEYRVTWPDGSLHWVEGRGRLFRDGQGEDARAVRVLGVLVDVTDRKTMEAERALRLTREQTARADAEAASRAKDEFLAMLSHELRNPLSAIGNAVAVLARIGDADPLLARARGVITRQLRHLSGLVDDLLDVARVTSGKIVLKRRPLDLSEAVRRCLSSMTSTRHRITTALEPVWLDGDETRIEQIAGNLLANAIKYTPAGGSISVKVQAQGEHAVLVVQDTGTGIPGDMLPRIFDLFSQGCRGLDRAQGGLGIGLTLVRRLVELHGGSIAAASAGPGCGSTFTVHLPRIPAPALAGPGHAALPAAPASHRRVLIVEDNPDVREMLQQIVELAGHEVAVAGDGPGGVERALAMRPDIALVDVGLPGYDGYEVARRIRADRAGQDMVLLALTGYGQDADRRAAMDAGFDHHLVKPVEPRALLALLAQAGRRVS